MPQLNELPLEIRRLIGDQIDCFITYTQFRAMDKTNFTLLPYYGIADFFKPTKHEYALVKRVCEKMEEYFGPYTEDGYICGDEPPRLEPQLVHALCERLERNFAYNCLDLPLKYNPRTGSAEEFREFHFFFVRLRDAARTTTRPLPIGDDTTSAHPAVEKLDSLAAFTWNPHPVILTDEVRHRFNKHVLVVRDRFHRAARFEESATFNFAAAVADVLGEYISLIYGDFYDPSWVNVNNADDAAGLVRHFVDWIHQVAVWVMRVRSWEDVSNGIDGM